MSRPPREFKPGSSELEGRLLLTVGSATPPSLSNTLVFSDAETSSMAQAGQVAIQNDGSATVHLSLRGNAHPGDDPFFPLQVVVATDPSSPASGLNFGAVHRTITFDNAHWNAFVTVPILPGAPNPGEVDVNLTITPINRTDVQVGPPLRLRIMASKDLLPPAIDSVSVTPQGVVLKFSKQMNPAGASNLKNYAVHSMSASLFGGVGNDVRLKSARYDPVTETVTIVTKHKLSGDAIISVRVGRQARASGLRGHRSNFGAPLTDLQGELLNTSVDHNPDIPAALIGGPGPAAGSG
jgi:hypothetical protein